MPHEVHHPAPANKPPNAKGKPLGIPKWGWAAAIAIGLVLGYVLLKRSSSNSATSTGSDAGINPSSPQGDSGGAGGGASSTPSPVITPGNNTTPTVTTEQQSPNPVPSPDNSGAPNFTTGAPVIPAPSGQTLVVTQSTPTYTIPTSGGGTSAPIKTSTGHGPQLTG